jgi:hypothetical protein
MRHSPATDAYLNIVRLRIYASMHTRQQVLLDIGDRSSMTTGKLSSCLAAFSWHRGRNHVGASTKCETRSKEPFYTCNEAFDSTQFCPATPRPIMCSVASSDKEFDFHSPACDDWTGEHPIGSLSLKIIEKIM